MSDINARVAALRAEQQRLRQRAVPVRRPPKRPQLLVPSPQSSGVGGLAPRFITWARQSGISLRHIKTIATTGRWFKRHASLEGWILKREQTPLTEDSNFSYAGSYDMVYAVTTDGRIAWHSVNGGEPPMSISWKVPTAGSNEGTEDTAELIARFIAGSGSRVPFPD